MYDRDGEGEDNTRGGTGDFFGVSGTLMGSLDDDMVPFVEEVVAVFDPFIEVDPSCSDDPRTEKSD